MPNAMTAEDQLALIRQKLSELFGLEANASEEQFAQAFDKFVADAEEESTSASEAKEKIEKMEASHKREMGAVTANYEAKLKVFSTELEDLREENAGFKAEKTTADAKNFSSSVETLVDGLIKEGKMLPAERAANITLLNSADRNTKLNFSDADGKEIQKTTYDTIVDALKARPKIVEFKAVTQAVEETAAPAKKDEKADDGVKRFSDAGQEVDEFSAKLDKRTREIMTEKKIGFGDAMVAASKELRK